MTVRNESVIHLVSSSFTVSGWGAVGVIDGEPNRTVCTGRNRDRRLLWILHMVLDEAGRRERAGQQRTSSQGDDA